MCVDRCAVHPVDEIVGGEGSYAAGVAGEVGVVEEVVPLTARAAAEERGGVDPMLRATGGNERVGPAAHRLERRRVDQTWPPVFVDVDAEAGGQLPHLSVQVRFQLVVVQGYDVEVVGGVAEGLQVLHGAP